MSHGRSFEARSSGSTRPLGPRSAACRAVEAHARRFPDLLAQGPETAGLSPQDAALARAIYRAVMTRWTLLAALLERRLTGPWARQQPAVQAGLLVGAAQLMLLDHVPAHAAIDETVEAVKRRAGPKSAGLINAVLRRVAADLSAERRETWTNARDEFPLSGGGAGVLAEAWLPEDEHQRLALVTGIAPWALARWASTLGPLEARRIAWHSLTEPPVVVRTAHASGPLPRGLAPHRAPGSAVWVGGAGLGEMLDESPGLWVQDASSSAAVEAVADLRPAVVVDMCSGTGTKTRQLRATFPDAVVVASDADRARVELLRRRFESDPGVVVEPLEELRERWLERGDLVVLDVPCTNSGVLARRPEARHRLSSAQLDRLAGVQRQIQADAIPLLAPRGAVLLSTCSIEPEENAGQAQWMARWHGFKASRQTEHRPEGGPGLDPAVYRDGAGAVLLTR